MHEAGVHVLTQRQDQRIGFQGLELASGARAAPFINLHHLDREGGFLDVLDGAQPVDLHILFERLVGLELVGRHVGAVAAVDDQRLVPQPFGDPGSIHRGVATAINGDPAAQFGGVTGFHVLEEADGVEHLAGIAGRDVGALADVSADGDKDRVEITLPLLDQ